MGRVKGTSGREWGLKKGRDRVWNGDRVDERQRGCYKEAKVVSRGEGEGIVFGIVRF